MVFIQHSILSNLNTGDSLYKDLENEIGRCDYVRKEMQSAIYHRSDPDQLRKFKDLFLEYILLFFVNIYCVGTIRFKLSSKSTLPMAKIE